VAWKFRYEKAEQAKRYAQTHQKTTEVAVEKKVPYEKCDNCDRTAYQKAKEKCDNRKIQLEKKYKNMTAGYESILFLLAWYSIAITLFTAILSPVFFSDCISFFSMFAKGILSLFQKFVAGADSFGQLSSGISNSIISGIVYWLIVSIVMGILFIITGLLIIGRAHQGDKAARDLLFEENTGLIYSVAKRFLGRGVEMEDLFQIGSIGLLKAVDKFDMSYDVKFSTYAVPMIIGEIKRYLRDDGILKVSRSLKENHYRIYQVREALTRRLEREPTMGEMAAEMGISIEELVMTMESGAEVESLHKTIYQGEGTEIALMDKLPEKENRQEKALDRIFLEEILGTLEAKERRLIYMRYFQNMTQMEIAHELGVSQVQVSRMEKRILRSLQESAEKK